MLKLALPLVLCLAYLWLEADAGAVGQPSAQGDNGNGPTGPTDCPESQVECIRDDCQQHCESVNYRTGICKFKIITCDTSDYSVRKCTCYSKSTGGKYDESETANAGGNSDSSDYNSPVTKTPKSGKTQAYSKAPASKDSTAGAGGQYLGASSSVSNAKTTTEKTPQRTTAASVTL